MKNMLIASLLGLSTLSFGLNAATEINHSVTSNFKKVGTVSASNGTIDELTRKISVKAESAGASHFKITYLNSDKLGYAHATIYVDTVKQSS